jgi:hypothetical protein
MSERLLNDKVNGYEVSTVRTDAGGAPRSYAMFGFFSSADYEDINAWPFETMVFKVGTRRGLYHEPYASEESAREGHARVLASVAEGTLEFGTTVTGDQGTPLITPDEWR